MAIKNDKKMNSMYQKDLYEDFHKITKQHRKIISENDFTHGFIIKMIEKYVTIKSSFLDVGCGTGSIDMYLAQEGHSVMGIDISTRAIKSCNESKDLFGLNNISFKSSTIEGLSVKKKFNNVLLLEVIEHIEDDKGALKKLNKIINKDGLLILSTPSINAPLYKLGLLDNFDKRVGHLRRYSENDLRNLVSVANFEIVEFKKIEGILRNFLFTFRLGGYLLKVLNRVEILSKLVTFIDIKLIKILGESNFILVAKKK